MKRHSSGSDDITFFDAKRIENEWLVFSKGDLLPIIAGIFVVGLCIMAGLISFYLVENQELIQAKADLNTLVLSGKNNLAKAITK
jgi:hypothetical protein